jgi:hypothetical protein
MFFLKGFYKNNSSGKRVSDSSGYWSLMAADKFLRNFRHPGKHQAAKQLSA